MARIISPSATRPLFNEDGSPTNQTREFFNLISKLSIEGDGNPNSSVDPLFRGQMYTDVSADEVYVNTDETNTGWVKIA